MFSVNLNHFANRVVFHNSTAVPDYPRPLNLTPSQTHSKLAYLSKRIPRYVGLLNYIPAAALLGSFFVYPTLTDRFKWHVGLPNAYTPTQEEIDAKK